jgi:solute carrier family 25 phosphate transporter 23/24/25/41
LDTPTRLVAGALAGITSVCTTYPLDLVRSRLSIASASITLPPSNASTSSTSSAISGARSAFAYHTAAVGRSAGNLGIWGMTAKVMREEGGVRALYRGIIATAMGVAPYVGINFAAYEALRGIITPPGKTTVARKLACGALAGKVSRLSAGVPSDR